MEFGFRAGEDRPPSYLPPSIADANLPPQSLRGISSHPDFTFTMPSSSFPTSSSTSLPQFPPGYLGPNLQRHDPLQNPMMIPVNPMMNHVNPTMMMPIRESVRRELEKERIREEIIAGEILRKRELEEEVRRELWYEREVALRRQAEQFSLQGRKHNKKAKEEEFLNKPPCGGNKTEAAELMNQNKVKEEWLCDLCNVRATSELDLKNGHLQGKKHKAKAKERELLIASETGGGSNIEAEELVIPKMLKMEWSCDLCHVMAPNEQALTEHLYGKKHKAREEELLIASKCDEGNKNEAAELINPNKVKSEAAELINPNKVKNEASELINPNKVKKEWSCAVCQVSPPNEQHLNKHLHGKKHKAKEEALIKACKPNERNKTEAAQLINPNNVKKEWSCSLCQPRAPSEQGLNEHLQGKKHKAKEEELLKASKPASSTTIWKKADNSNTLEKQGVTSNEQQKKLQQQVPKEAKEILCKQLLLHYCEHCKLQCNSESMLASHLRGKKHLSRMRSLKAMLVAEVNEESRADLVAKTMEENIKPSGNSNKGPALNKDDKSNKLVNKVMTTSSSKWPQKLQVGQSEQQVPKKQSKAVKKVPVPCELCNVECYGEFMLESHLSGKKHLARMKELESGKEVSVNHTEDVNAGVTYGRNEESEVDANKAVEIIEMKQSIGSRQDEKEVGSERTSIGSHQDAKEVGSERTSIGSHQDEKEVGSERTSIGNHQDGQGVESERTSIGNHQDEQVVALETMDGVRVPSTEEVANRMEDGARKNFSLGNLTHAIVRFLFIFSVAGY
ncbi:hypothetical protein MRB53_013530 [Persea americana]|uniref:Uncharacterized protein n=1 Tax=Persea americana TaxID=3435 RepID=A0ACC2K897_PERAE|nr:hypothetical protein MRB53_013530 [Persea americana]